MSPKLIESTLLLIFVLPVLFFFAIDSRTIALAVLLAGVVPIGISAVSLLLFFRVETKRTAAGHDRFVLINFLVKVVLIGTWLTSLLLATKLPHWPVVISLLANFLAWHLYEAYRYQSHLTSLSSNPR
ncbi:hypothetical protein ACFL6E_04215 [Candidatus Neomarinimicrobiota bacterium]